MARYSEVYICARVYSVLFSCVLLSHVELKFIAYTAIGCGCVFFCVLLWWQRYRSIASIVKAERVYNIIVFEQTDCSVFRRPVI